MPVMGSGVYVDVVVIVAAPMIVAALGNGNANVGVADTVDDLRGTVRRRIRSQLFVRR
jgi:hypothetical protein